MKKNGAVDIICKVISVLLSIVLVPMIIVTVLFASVSSLLKPETLVNIVTNIDYGEILGSFGDELSVENERQNIGAQYKVSPQMLGQKNNELSPQKMMSSFVQSESGKNAEEMPVEFEANASESSVESALPNSGSGFDMNGLGGALDGFLGEIAGDITEGEAGEMVGEIVEDFLETDVAQEIFGEYAQSVTDAISGKEDAQVDEEKIKEIIIENKDEIFDFVEQYTGQKLDRDALGGIFDQVVEENIGTLVDNLPKPQEFIKEIPPEVLKVVNLITSGTVLNILLTIDGLLIVLIFILRLWEFSGFLWLSINGIVSGAILAIIWGAVSILKNVILVMLGQFRGVISPILKEVTGQILLSFIVIFLISAVFMTLFFVIKNLRKKKKEAMNLGTTEL